MITQVRFFLMKKGKMIWPHVREMKFVLIYWKVYLYALVMISALIALKV